MTTEEGVRWRKRGSCGASCRRGARWHKPFSLGQIKRRGDFCGYISHKSGEGLSCWLRRSPGPPGGQHRVSRASTPASPFTTCPVNPDDLLHVHGAQGPHRSDEDTEEDDG